MKKIYFIVIMFFTLAINAQTFQWALQKHYSAQSGAESVGTDKYGNVYLTGRFIPDYAQYFGSTWGCVILKYTSSGNLLWTDTVLNVIRIRSVTDSLGNTYATGYFKGSVTFGNTTFNANGFSGGFITKYDSNGQCIWAKNIYGFGIALSLKDGLFVTSTDGGGLNTSANTGELITRFDTNGNVVWTSNSYVKNFNGLGLCNANSISVDRNDNIYITGQFKDTVVLGAGSNTATMIYNGPYNNNYIAKYDSTGNLQWLRVPSIPSYGFESQFPFYVSCDSSGNSFISGTFYNTLTIGANTYSAGNNAFILLAKFNSNGNLIWSKSISGTVNNLVYGIGQDKNRNLFLTGGFGGTTNLGNGVTMSSNCSAFVIKFDKDGSALWAAYPTQNNTGCSTGLSICADGKTNVYMVGRLSGNTNIFGNTSLSTPQYTDLLLTKINDPQIINTGLIPNSSLIKDNLFLFYPNPTADVFYINGKNYIAEKTEIKISNAIGQCLFSKSCKVQGTELNEQIDLSHFPKGIYFILISTGNATEVRKIVLE